MNRRANDGFSLVEMLVALAIVSLVMIAAFSNPFSSKRGVSIDLAAHQVAAKLNSASAKAVAGGRPVEVLVDVTGHNLALEGEILNLPADLEMQLKTGLELLESSNRGTLIFMADGSASGGEIRLQTSNGQSRAVRINWVTGGVAITGDE